MTKVYYTPLVTKWYREYELQLQGLKESRMVELVENPDDADLIFCSCFSLHDSCEQNCSFAYNTIPRIDLNKFDPNKLVLIDWWDKQTYFIPNQGCKAYFKRSIAKWADAGNYSTKTILPLPEKHYPMFFSIIDQYYFPEETRDIDLGCFFTAEGNGNRNRVRLLKMCGRIKDCNKYLREPSPSGEEGRDGINSNYFKTMKRCKIIATCEPDLVEGCQRTWECFASGALVCVDKWHVPFENMFEDGVHCILFENDDKGLEILKERIEYYLNHPEEASLIAKTGFEYAKKHHRAVNRVENMLEKVKTAL